MTHVDRGHPSTSAARRRRRERSIVSGGRPGSALVGWLFVTPAVVVLGIFLLLPMLLAFYVSLTSWNGNGTPFDQANAPYVGLQNYAELLTGSSLTHRDFVTSLGNTFWYVVLVVPLQTTVALLLALALRAPQVRCRGTLRTAFYLPSVTSSVAMAAVFLFLFAGNGATNRLLALIGIDGPNWFAQPEGIGHIILHRLGQEDAGWTTADVLGRTVWDWLTGPSLALLVLVALAVWTTSGTFLVIFLAALADLPREVDEAAALDGATGWRKLWYVTLPQLRPTLLLVVTLGVIGTWQVFDQIYVTGGGGPAKTTLTPAYLSYRESFTFQNWGAGAAIAFLLCFIIIAFTAFAWRFLAVTRSVPSWRPWRPGQSKGWRRGRG